MTALTTLSALVAENPLAPPRPALVLFGRDSTGKPRAGWFGSADVAAATAATAGASLRVLHLNDDEQRKLAGELSCGRMLPSGRAYVPFAKRELYARLVALAGGETGHSASGAAGRPHVAASADLAGKARPGERTFVGRPLPQDHDEIGLGSIVLAHEGPEQGWWEAEVIGINGRVFSLRWRDYPTQPTILRRANELALLPLGKS